jgi:MYXO-CTERM domain-containing protein
MERRPRRRAWSWWWAAAATALLAAAVTGAVADGGDAPRLDPEFDVSPPLLTGASGEQTMPRAAWNGQEYLVTWRSSFWKDELRATRMTGDGKILDGRGVRIAGRERNAGSAAVAAGPGGPFLVAHVADPAQVMVSLARNQGGLQVSEPVRLFDGAADFTTSELAVAFADPVFWVLWARQSASPQIVAARVGADGVVRDPVPVVLGPGFGAVAAAAEGAEGAEAATWALWGTTAAPDMVQLRVASLDTVTGGVTPAGGTLLQSIPGQSAGEVALAVGGGHRLAAAAVTSTSGISQTIHLVPFDAAGAPLLALPTFLFAGGAGTRLHGGPSLIWGPGAFILYLSVDVMVAGKLTPQLRAWAIDPVTWRPEPLGVPTESRAGQHPFLAAAATAGPGAGLGPMLIWEEVVRLTAAGEPADSDVLATHPPLAPMASAAVPPVVVSLAPHAHSEPAIAWNGQQALVAFEDAREDKAGRDVYFARIDGEGRPLDGPGRHLGIGPAPQHAPMVAWDGQHFVVAWHEGQDGLALARVSGEGTVLDQPPQRVSGSEGQLLLSEPAICGTGGGSLLMWAARKTANPTDTELRALRIARGQPLDATASFVVSRTADTSAPVLRLGCNDKAAILVWSGKRVPGGPEASTLNLGRLLPGGQTFDVAPGVLTLAPDTTEEWAGIASDGDRFLVGWRSFNDRRQRTVYAARIDGQGQLLDRPFIAVGQSNSGRRVTTLWDGQQWVVMAVNTEGGNPFELRGRRLTPAGEVADPSWFRVATLSKPWGGGGGGAEGVVVAPGRSLLVYEQYPEDDASSNPRARARYLVTPLRLPGAAGDAATGADAGDGSVADGGAGDSATGDGPAGAGGGGCDCAVGGGRTAPPVMVIVVMGGGLAIRRRRRRHRRP